MMGGCGKNEVKTEASAWTAGELPPTHISEKLNETITLNADVHVLPGFESGIADMVSTLLPNIFVVCASPLVFRYVLGHLVWALTNARFLTEDYIYDIYGEIFPTMAGNLAYALFVTVVLIFGMELASRKMIVRRLRNE